MRKKLEKFFYIPIKGMSTKGVDIVAINKYLCLIIEVKTFNNYLKINEKQIKNLFEEEKKIKKFLDIPVIKMVALVKGNKFKFLIINELKNITIKKEDFEKLEEFSYSYLNKLL